MYSKPSALSWLLRALCPLTLLLSGCGEDTDSTSAPPAPSTTPAAPAASPAAPVGPQHKPNVDPDAPTERQALCGGATELLLHDDTNYTFSNELRLEHSVVKARTNLLFDWSGVTQDMFRRDIDPATELGSVLVSLWPMTPSEIEEALKTDDLSTSLARGAITAYPDGSFTSVNLLNFTVFGEDLPEDDVWNWFDTSLRDYKFPQDTHTFLLSVSGGTLATADQRMIKTFSLDPDAAEERVSLSSSSTELSFQLDLLSPLSVSLPRGNADLELDWHGITETALGKPYVDFNVSEVVVAQYDMTRQELEDNFLQLRDLAAGQWGTTDLAGSSVNLSDLRDDSGQAFPGITQDGLWLAAMFCTVSCNNPAPVSIVFLEPCD